MIRLSFVALVTCALLHIPHAGVNASEIVLLELDSKLVPGPVEYAVIAPDGYKSMQNLPLILNLHGGGGSRDNLVQQQGLWDRLWDSSQIPPVIVVMPSVTPRGLYMNFRDGSERWEDFIIGPFLEHLREAYPVTSDARKTFLMGASMGGMGSLRMAFRYPERFGAVAALEPGIEPILKWQEMRPKHRFWRSDELFERAYGKPVDADYWARNNPATMATLSADRIRKSGLQIYVEAGDEDQFWLYEGAEFLHQILWQEKIKHEYHLVRGGDHVGPSLRPRIEEAIRFLIRSYEPWGEPPFKVRAIMKFIELQKLKVDEKDHYNQPE
jgi:S-formylglutathione hydrolase